MLEQLLQLRLFFPAHDSQLTVALGCNLLSGSSGSWTSQLSLSSFFCVLLLQHMDRITASTPFRDRQQNSLSFVSKEAKLHRIYSDKKGERGRAEAPLAFFGDAPLQEHTA